MTNVAFVGAKQAGCVGLLTVLACGLHVSVVVAHDPILDNLARRLGLKVEASVHAIDASEITLLVNVHGREFIPSHLQANAINVHPCLSQFPGADPIGRLLASRGAWRQNTRASVGVHRMTSVIDHGEILAETWVDVHGLNTREEIYNRLYPVYATTLIEALGVLGVVVT